MFKRNKPKSKAKGPVANQLKGAAKANVLKAGGSTKPNVLKAGKPGKSKVERDDELEETTDSRTPAQRRADLEAELQRQAEEFGLTALDPVNLYGPNGEEVAALVDSLADLDDETAEAIADAYESVPEAERKVAQSVVRRRHRNGKLWGEVDTAERAVADWLTSMALENEDDAALYEIVAAAATDAVDALVLEDELADSDFTTLYGPWSEVMDSDEDEDAEEEAEEKGSAEAEENAEDAEDDAKDEGEFGPNTALIGEFLTKLGALNAAQTAELVAAWREQPKENLRVAHRSLQDLADESKRWREQMRLAQEEIFTWMEGEDSKYLERSHAPKEEIRLRESAGPALADAVAALVMTDMLDADEAETLYAAWAEVVGEPALPQYEEDEED
jgi:hypothetical protein